MSAGLRFNNVFISLSIGLFFEEFYRDLTKRNSLFFYMKNTSYSQLLNSFTQLIHNLF